MALFSGFIALGSVDGSLNFTELSGVTGYVRKAWSFEQPLPLSGTVDGIGSADFGRVAGAAWTYNAFAFYRNSTGGPAAVVYPLPGTVTRNAGEPVVVAGTDAGIRLADFSTTQGVAMLPSDVLAAFGAPGATVSIYPASGTHVRRANATLFGSFVAGAGGGGGGGAVGATIAQIASGGGGGGGGGGIFTGMMPAAGLPAVLTLTVGAGGTGGAPGANGTAGGFSQITGTGYASPPVGGGGGGGFGSVAANSGGGGSGGLGPVSAGTSGGNAAGASAGAANTYGATFSQPGASGTSTASTNNTGGGGGGSGGNGTTGASANSGAAMGGGGSGGGSGRGVNNNVSGGGNIFGDATLTAPRPTGTPGLAGAPGTLSGGNGGNGGDCGLSAAAGGNGGAGGNPGGGGGGGGTSAGGTSGTGGNGGSGQIIIIEV